MNDDLKELGANLAIVGTILFGFHHVMDWSGAHAYLTAATWEPAVKVLFWVLVYGAVCVLSLRFLHYYGVVGSGASPIGTGSREKYDALRRSLISQKDVEDGYARRLNAFLAKVDGFFGDAGKAEQRFWPLREPAALWTAPAFDCCLLLAFFYPIMTIFIVWAVSGEVGPAEQALRLTSVDYWRRLAVIASLGATVFAYWHLPLPAQELELRWFVWHAALVVTSFVAGAVVVAIVGFSVVGLIVIVAVALALALGGIGAGVGAGAVAGVVTLPCAVAVGASAVTVVVAVGRLLSTGSGFLVGAGPLVVVVAVIVAVAIIVCGVAVFGGALLFSRNVLELNPDKALTSIIVILCVSLGGGFVADVSSRGAFPDPVLVAGAGIAIGVGVGVRVHDMSVKQGSQDKFQILFLLIGFVVCLASARWLPSFSDWDRTSPPLLFLGLLTLINAPFDWLALGLTRLLLRWGIQKGGQWPYVFALGDAILASALIALLAVAMVFATDWFNYLAELGGGEKARVLPPMQFYLAVLRAGPQAPEYWWLYATLFSTMIPSVINLFIAGFSFLRGLPMLRLWLLSVMRENEALPATDRIGAAAILTLQNAVAVIVAVAVQAFLTWSVIYHIMPRLGLGILDLAEKVAM